MIRSPGDPDSCATSTTDLPWSWKLMVADEALYQATVSSRGLAEFARSSAANFLVVAIEAATPAYRLFHQALNDSLRSARQDTAVLEGGILPRHLDKRLALCLALADSLALGRRSAQAF
jgi:hypothetical protein